MTEHVQTARPVPRPAAAPVLLGPAVVAALAYVDPGNFATCFSAGAQDGYRLLWVVLAASVAAAFLQYLAAALGAAGGLSLPELCRRGGRQAAVLGLWLQAETVCAATDVAEVVGTALALNLLFGLPPVCGALVAGAVGFVLPALTPHGQRGLERVMAAALAGVCLLVLPLAALSHPRPAAVAAGLLPGLSGTGTLTLAAGIVGATVMPHTLYLHSALTTGGRREAAGRGVPAAGRTLAAVRAQRGNIAAAMSAATLVNLGLLVLAGARLGGRPDASLTDAFAVFDHGSHAAALAFALALLIAGLASTVVGTHAGQEVMRGFLHRSLSPALRRLVTLLPSVALLAAGVPLGTALVLSQVVLCFGIPFALVPLLLALHRIGRGGRTAAGPRVLAVGWATAALVILLDLGTLATLL